MCSNEHHEAAFLTSCSKSSQQNLLFNLSVCLVRYNLVTPCSSAHGKQLKGETVGGPEISISKFVHLGMKIVDQNVMGRQEKRDQPIGSR